MEDAGVGFGDFIDRSKGLRRLCLVALSVGSPPSVSYL